MQKNRYSDMKTTFVPGRNPGQKTTALETESGVEYTVTYTLQGEIGVQQELYLH